MARIRDEDIVLVRERARIDEVVREYVGLKSAGGGSLKGLCPFHEERSPSFHVTPSKGFWYCFGCGEGGDVVGFLRKIDHLSFARRSRSWPAATACSCGTRRGGRPRTGSRVSAPAWSRRTVSRPPSTSSSSRGPTLWLAATSSPAAGSTPRPPALRRRVRPPRLGLAHLAPAGEGFQ